MPIRLIFVLILNFLISELFTQNTDNLLGKIDNVTNLTETQFRISVDKMKDIKFDINDTTLVYKRFLKGIIDRENLKSDMFQLYHVALDLAGIYASQLKYDSSFYYINRSIKYIQIDQYPNAYYKAFTLGANYAYEMANYSMANYFLEDLLNSNFYKEDETKTKKILLKLASNYLGNHQYEISMNYCDRLYSILNDQIDGVLKVNVLLMMYNNAHFSTSDSSNLHYLNLAKEKALILSDSSLLSDVYITYGKAYYRRGEYSEAIRFYRLGRKLVVEKGGRSDLYAAIYQQLVYTLMEDSLDQVCELSQYILDHSNRLHAISYLSNAYRGRAYCMAKNGEVDSARYYIMKSAENRLKYGKPNASPGFYYYLYEICLMIKDYDLALEFLNKSLAQEKHINKVNNTDNLSKVRAKFDYQLQKLKISELKLEKAIEEERSKVQSIIILFGILIIIGGLTFTIVLRLNYKKLKISFHALVKKHIEIDKLNNRSTDKKSNNGKRSGMYIKDEQEIYEKLNGLIDSKKILLKNEISLSQLAEMINTNTTYLSSIINSRYQVSFKNLLNKYRIDEARKILIAKEYENYSVEGIASEVGYHSRSAFYQMFKHFTGMTPTQYIASYKEVSSEDFLEPVEMPHIGEN